MVSGECPLTNCLLMGDFWGRCHNCVEISLSSCAEGVLSGRIGLICGNREWREIAQIYGFYDECLYNYKTVNVWR